jgi:4-amino-4-deoxy-L-arabinose transferase-like glycosyltransferase
MRDFGVAFGRCGSAIVRMRPVIYARVSQQDRPGWSRPALIAVIALAAALTLIDVTRSGYGNTYYAAGALAASRSWSALLNNAADLGGYVSLDKGPLPDWLMGLSGRVFGFGSFSVMVPNALYATAAVFVLHDTVRRVLGHQIAIVAALIMALTPVVVLVGRYNAPDALLLLLLVCAAWSLTLAVQSGQLRELSLCAVFVGLGFNTKMLEAYLVAPALILAYLLAAPGSLRRRLGELALAAGVALLVSIAWFGAMTLVPAGERPYVGDSGENSWFGLILEGNGIQRVAGSSGAFARQFESNLTYLFGAHLAGQIAWLLPLALCGLLVGLRVTWGSRRTRPAFGAYVMWGGWALVGCVVLSFSAGTRHAYYTSVLAPAIATLAASALVTLWHSARRSRSAALALALAVGATAAISFAVLADSGAFVPWLRWLVIACGGAFAAAAVLWPRARAALHGRVTRVLGIGVAAVAVLGGPAAYSLATAARAHTGYSPTAGPVLSATTAADGRGRPHQAVAASATATGAVFAASLALLGRYLQVHRGRARFLVAATDAKTADPIALATREPVITLGGYTGSDPAPTIAQVQQLIGSARLRFVLLDATRVQPASAAQRARAVPAWVERHCARVPDTSIAGLAAAAAPQSRIVSTLALFACDT